MGATATGKTDGPCLGTVCADYFEGAGKLVVGKVLEKIRETEEPEIATQGDGVVGLGDGCGRLRQQ